MLEVGRYRSNLIDNSAHHPSPCAQDREREKELEMIKAQYLGGEKKKKKVLKGAEKFKFNFDWEAGDDTSRDLNPLYNSTHGAHQECPCTH